MECLGRQHGKKEHFSSSFHRWGNNTPGAAACKGKRGRGKAATARRTREEAGLLPFLPSQKCFNVLAPALGLGSVERESRTRRWNNSHLSRPVLVLCQSRAYNMLQPRLWQQQPWRQAQCLFRSSTNAFARRTYASATEGPKVATATRETTTTSTDTVAFNPPTAAPSRRRGGFELRTYKPRTPSLRHLRRPINDHLWKGKPLSKLTFAKVGHGKGGRNCTGRVTVRHRGGGHRRRIRTVDFKRMEPGKHTVERIEYDPNRSTHLALVTRQKTGEKSYVLAADGMRAGDVIESYRAGIPGELLKSMGGVMDPGMLAAKTAFRGNCLPVRMIPLGTQIYAVGSTTGKGAVFCRSAGTFAVVVSKEEVGKKVKEVTVRLQSGEVRRVSPEACATIGVASNPHHHFRTLGKAGRSRWLNIRPTVRGLAMNAGKFNLTPNATVSHLTVFFSQPTILTVWW
jgi:ribosomal protein L2